MCGAANVQPILSRRQELKIGATQKLGRCGRYTAHLAEASGFRDEGIQGTLEMWTPRWRCTPEQAAQKSTPRFSDAHSGPRAPQSAHASLPRTPASAAASASPATVLSRDTAVCASGRLVSSVCHKIVAAV